MATVREGSGWTPLSARVEEIVIKGRGAQPFPVRSTPRGPLYSDLTPGWSGPPVSLHWTGMEVSHELDAFLALNRATSVADAIAARALAATPPLNMAAADGSGNIATISFGWLPIRPEPAGILDAAAHPPRYVPVEELALEINPSRGWIAQANNRIASDGYQHPFHAFYEPLYRIRRIEDELGSRDRHSIADMRALQLDVYSLHAAELSPILVTILQDDASIPLWWTEDLRSWDFQTRSESRASLLFEVFYRHWVRESLRVRLPLEMVEALSGMLSAGAVPMEFCDRLLNGEYSAWLDEDQRRAVARSSVHASIAWIEERLGVDRQTWSWGALHTVTFTHPLGQIDGPHQRFVNVGPFAVPGNRTTVWPSGDRTSAPFAITGGPSMRFVTDLRRPELSWMTNTLGQHGWPLSRHYRDQVDDLLKGHMHPIWGQPRRKRTTILPVRAGCPE